MRPRLDTDNEMPGSAKLLDGREKWTACAYLVGHILEMPREQLDKRRIVLAPRGMDLRALAVVLELGRERQESQPVIDLVERARWRAQGGK